MGVQGFILQENIKLFRERLAQARDDGERAWLEVMLSTAEREHALLEAERVGASARARPPLDDPEMAAVRDQLKADFRQTFYDVREYAVLLDPGPGLLVVDVNRTKSGVRGLGRDQIIGRPIFLTFPDNPTVARAEGVARMYAALRAVAQTGHPQTLEAVRHDVRRPGGHYAPRYWRIVNSPLHDEGGRLVFLIQVFIDITGGVRRAGRAAEGA